MRGSALELDKQYFKAIEDYDKYIETGPKEYTDRLDKAENYLLDGKNEMAIEEYNYVIEKLKDADGFYDPLLANAYKGKPLILSKIVSNIPI